MLAHENPFRSERIEALAFRPQGEGWTEIMDRLKRAGYRGAIVGPKGSGKTTMIEELRLRLEEAGWNTVSIRLTEESGSSGKEALRKIARKAGDRTLILLDGAEQLGLVRWLAFRRRAKKAGGLVVTMHRPGRLKTIHGTATSPELLRELIEELAGEGFAGNDCEGMHRNHGGNLREIFFVLFRRCMA